MDREIAAHINYSIENCKDLSDTIGNITLKKYQSDICKAFLGLDDFTNLLLFWDTGYGKTITVIYIIKNIFIKVFPNWKIIILVKSSLRYDPWENTIKKYIPDLYKYIIFIHYDSENSLVQFTSCLKGIVVKTERVMVIIDEVHQFISRIIPRDTNIRPSVRLYNKLLSLMEHKTNRIICLSATPIINRYSEFKYLIRLLRPNLIFDDNYIINNVLMGKNTLYETLAGVSSYQRLDDNTSLENVPALNGFAKKNVIFHNIYMSEAQSNLYNDAEKIDFKNKIGGLRTMRRLVSSFVFNELKLKQNMGEKDYIHSIKDKLKKFKKFIESVNFEDEFIEQCIKNDTIPIENYKNINNVNHYNLLYEYSCKYMETCKIILRSSGKCLIYQPFVSFEGIATLNNYLQLFNITFVEYSKNTLKTRDILVNEFNNINNINGEIIKVCIFSAAGNEGISFNCINDIIIMDIPWSESILKQIIGRSLRLNSHEYIKEVRNYVDIHVLISYTKNNKSIDKELLNLMNEKYKGVKIIYDLLKETSIETLISKYPYDIVDANDHVFDNIKNNKLIPFSENNVIVNKYLVPIHFSYNDLCTSVYQGYLDAETNIIYEQNVPIYTINIDTKILIKDNKYIYILKK
jgi:superfamily II DNA or RNA helicase